MFLFLGLFYSLSQFHSACEDDDILNEASFLARNLVEHIGAAIVTMGGLGVLVRTTLFIFLREEETPCILKFLGQSHNHNIHMEIMHSRNVQMSSVLNYY
jgi:hypothetical protein